MVTVNNKSVIHATRHQTGGDDVVVPDLHASRHESGGADEVDLSNLHLHQLRTLLGDARILLTFSTTGTTITDKTRHARVFTWNEEVGDFDTAPAALGSGTTIDFNGTDEEADTPDTDNLSFGDGAVDEAFSVCALINPDQNSVQADILSKWDDNNGAGQLREWRLITTVTNGYPRLELYDESADASIGREDQTAVVTGSWQLLTFTYDGSASVTGIRGYLNGARTDDADSTAGTYVAMENSATVVSLASELDTGGAAAKTDFFDGEIALVVLVAKELTIDEVWNLKEIVNSFFNLSL